MCGVVAILSPAHSAKGSVEKALAALRHRGPDGAGVWAPKSGGFALGHTRLAVRGELSDTQPIVNRSGDIAVSVNGEFYGADEERRRLEDRGYSFRTTSDSEIALRLYEELGVDFVGRLRGEFALVLWDDRRGRLVAARDRFGIKPLNYVHNGDEFALASEAKALFAAGVCRADWDRDSFWHSLAHQYLPPGRTLFHGVKSVPPAHVLVAQRGMEPVLVPYWKPTFKEEAVEAEELRNRLAAAVHARLESRVQPAFSLSGGVDSGAVVAIATKYCRKPLPTFTVSWCDSSEFDEAGLVGEFGVGIRREVIPVSRTAMVTELSDAIYFSEGLAINGQLVGKFLLSRAIRNAGHNVVLSGEGADEAFLGYAHLQSDAGVLDFAGGIRRQQGIMLPAASGGLDQLPEPPSWLGGWPAFLRAKMGFQAHFRPLLREDAVVDFMPDERVRSLLDLIGESGEIPEDAPFPKKAAWLWTRTALAGYILRTLGDGAEMAHSVEGRPPFLDHEFFEMAASVAVGRNLKQGRSKALLRDALRGVLPDTLRERPKHPFIAPPLLSEGRSDAVVEFVADQLRSTAFDRGPFFDPKRTRSWFDGLLRAGGDRQAAADPALMTILSAILLQERFGL